MMCEEGEEFECGANGHEREFDWNNELGDAEEGRRAITNLVRENQLSTDEPDHAMTMRLHSRERMGSGSARKYDRRARMRALVMGATMGKRIASNDKQINVQGVSKGKLSTTARAIVKVTLGWQLVYEFEVWIMPHYAGVDLILGTDFMFPAGVRLDLFNSTENSPKYRDWQVLAYETAIDKALLRKEQRLHDDWLAKQPPAVETKPYWTPTRVLKRSLRHGDGELAELTCAQRHEHLERFALADMGNKPTESAELAPSDGHSAEFAEFQAAMAPMIQGVSDESTAESAGVTDALREKNRVHDAEDEDTWLRQSPQSTGVWNARLAGSADAR
ncbi:hypothetical protein ON010_g7713 [Phytophthora cinnamomi]|nr:hypothetical protein ON010_g7713 [Phytophthora cinnamomi]